MIQKVMIEVDSSTPLHNMGDGHIIVYDMSKRRYYATTRESFMREQNLKVQKVEEEFEMMKNAFEELKKEIERWKNKLAVDLDTNQEKFANKMETEKNSFLKTYKETNAKMIDMIEKHIIK